ncbi:MAG: beta-1,6-N-acetylglucosaminyltransferase [Proteobacteria bacterium]|nr:beta-1,6-N-acetylglucosaminyltransferase [Pseudomonadota bacterium]
MEFKNPGFAQARACPSKAGAAGGSGTVAYLVLAHAADEQLRLLTDELLAEGRSRVYLHLDAKVLDLKWLDSHARSRLFLIADRRALNWGGYSIVEATLRLLRVALSEAGNQRFVLLSGSCFPLRTVGEINDDLIGRTTPLIALWGRIDPSLKHGEGLGRHVVTKFHPYDNPFMGPTTSRMHERAWNAYAWIDGLLPYERKVDLRDLWKGSQFFVVDRDMAEACLRPPRALVHALRYALAPDEIFFTSIILGCLRARGTNVPTVSPSAPHQGGHFILKRRPACRSLRERLFRRTDLRQLTVADVDEAMASGALFARKCSADVSKAIAGNSG